MPLTDEHVLIVSHPRSGTHLAIDSVINNFEKWAAQPYLNLDRLRAGHERPLSVEDVKLRLERGPHVIKSHMHANVADFFRNVHATVELVKELLEKAKLIYVHRDGRDVMVSLYYYLSGIHQELAGIEFSEFLRMTDDQYADTIPRPMQRPEFWSFHVQSWMKQAGMFHLSFEDLRYRYDSSLDLLAEFLGQPKPKDQKSVIREVIGTTPGNVWLNRLQKVLMKLRFGITSTSVDFREGVKGSHLSHFGQEDLAFFLDLAGPTMKQIGYQEP